MTDIKKPTLLENIRRIAGLPQLVENRQAMRDPEEARQAGMSSGMDDVASNQYSDDQADAQSAQNEEIDGVMDELGIPRSGGEDMSDDEFQSMVDEVCQAYPGDIDCDTVVQRLEDRLYDKHGDASMAPTNNAVGESVKYAARLAEMAVIRKLAGLPLFEAQDDDDEDADVASANREIAKQKKAGGKAAKGWEQAEKAAKKTDADKDVEATKPTSKVETTAKPDAKAEPKADEDGDKTTVSPAAEEKFIAMARRFLSTHPDAKAGDLRKHCKENNIGLCNHFNSRFDGLKKAITKAAMKKGLKEGYVLMHPHMANFILAENTAINQYQWVSLTDNTNTLDPAVFESEAAAVVVRTYVQDYKSQASVLTKFNWAD